LSNRRNAQSSASQDFRNLQIREVVVLKVTEESPALKQEIGDALIAIPRRRRRKQGAQSVRTSAARACGLDRRRLDELI
jgi:hypothetical protein